MDTPLRGDNHNDTRERNTRLVLRALMTYGSMSRRQISALSGLAPGTISNLVNNLIERGVLLTVGTERTEGSRGGPSHVLVDFNPQGIAVLGVSLGIYSKSVALFDPRGQVHGHAFTVDLDPSAEATPGQELDWVVETARRLMQESGLPASAVVGVGVGAEGVVDPVAGVRTLVPYRGWRGLAVGRELEERLGMPVVVANSVHAAAAGEVRFGRGRHVDSLVYVLAGTTVACAAVINKEVLRGHDQFAGAIGHVVVRPDGEQCICGKRGCLETVAGERAVRAAGQEAVRTGRSSRLVELSAGHPEAITVQLVAQAAREGDPAAAGLLADAAVALGSVLATVVTLLGPELIVVQANLARFGGEAFLGPLERTIGELAFTGPDAQPPVVQAAVSADGDEPGAAVLALDRFFFSPQLVGRGRSLDLRARQLAPTS
jgi:predicted NBD/HSP70 family sugar kinase